MVVVIETAVVGCGGAVGCGLYVFDHVDDMPVRAFAMCVRVSHQAALTHRS